jgi:ribosomal protein S18 acetylase RimI-like enzyme
MRRYVVQTWGAWHPEEQATLHDGTFDPAVHQVVSVAGQAVGILAVVVHNTHVQLEKLYLLPPWQNQGLGSALLLGVLAQAAQLNKPVWLRVLKANESAKRFYERHGFRVMESSLERHFMSREA